MSVVGTVTINTRVSAGHMIIKAGGEPIVVDLPADLDAADEILARNGFGRVGPWRFDFDLLAADLREIHNDVMGIRPFDMWGMPGSGSHEEWTFVRASAVEAGDLITDSEFSDVALVGDTGVMPDKHVEGRYCVLIAQVGTGGSPAEAYCGYFGMDQLVRVARRKR